MALAAAVAAEQLGGAARPVRHREQVERRRHRLAVLGLQHTCHAEEEEVGLLRLAHVVEGLGHHGDEHVEEQQRHEHDEAEEQDRAHEGLLGGGDAVEVRLAVDGELEQHHEHRGELVEPVVAGRAGGRDAAAVEREESAREGEQHHGDDGHELGEVDHHAEDHEHERAERAEEVEEPHVPQEDEDHCEGVERARRVQGVGRGARPSQDAQHHRGGGDEVSEQPQHTPLVGAERAPQPDSALVDAAVAAGVAASHSHGNGEATQCEAA